MAPLRPSPLTASRTLKSLQQAHIHRPFNTISRIRQSVHNLEPHPFEHFPTTTKAAPGDWGKQFKWVGSATMFFLPAFGLVLGWPLIAEAVLDGHVG